MPLCNVLTNSHEKCKRSVDRKGLHCFQHKSKSRSVSRKSKSKSRKLSRKTSKSRKLSRDDLKDKIDDLRELLGIEIPKSLWTRENIELIIKKNFYDYFIDRFFDIWQEKLEDPFKIGDRHGSSDEASNFVEFLKKKNGVRHPLYWWLVTTDKQIISELKNNRTSYYDKIQVPYENDLGEKYSYALKNK